MRKMSSMIGALLAFTTASSLGSAASESLFAACDLQREAIDLLQRESLKLHSAHQQRKSSAPVATIKSFMDSECGSATGTETNITLQDEPTCFFGWKYACGCQGGSTVVVGEHYTSANCSSSTEAEKHILPLDTCLDGERATNITGVFQTVSLHGSCPGCSGSSKTVSLRTMDKSAPTVSYNWYFGPACTTAEFFMSSTVVADGETPQFPGHTYTCDCTAGNKKKLTAKVVGGPGDGWEAPDGVCHYLGDGIWVLADLTACPLPGKATCTIHGDPHITVFDDAEVALLLGVNSQIKQANAQHAKDADDVFGWGDFWLVKSDQVHIQARYRKVYYPNAREPLNHTYLTAVAVGGPFMGGSTLIVEPRSGSVVWAHAGGSREWLSQESARGGEGDEDKDFVFEEELIKASYSDRAPIVPEHAGSLVRGLDVELPSNVKLLIDRFGKHLDMRIEMAAAAGGAGGVDGQCGNFNGDPKDDTTDMLEQRIGYQVPAGELLFS